MTFISAPPRPGLALAWAFSSASPASQRHSVRTRCAGTAPPAAPGMSSFSFQRNQVLPRAAVRPRWVRGCSHIALRTSATVQALVLTLFYHNTRG